MSIKALELALIVGIAFGLGFWQLYDVNKAMNDERDDVGPDERRDSADTDSAATRDSDSNAGN